MNGTAATMNIEENLALAYRRGQGRTLRWGITAKERDEYREKLATLGLGLGFSFFFPRLPPLSCIPRQFWKELLTNV